MLSCLPFAQAAAAPDIPAVAPTIELSLVVLDAEPADAAARRDEHGDASSEAIAMLPSERGAFVALRVDCDPTGLDPCRPGRPMAVLTTFEGLKRFVAGLAPQTRLEWSPSCLGPWPREYPLSGSGASDDIVTFAARHRVQFVIHKAG